MSFATHILVPTDFSEASQEAVAKGGELANSAGTKLTLLHVHGHPPGAPEAFVPTDKVTSAEDLDRETLEALKRVKSSQLANVESVSLVAVEHISPPLAICDYAEKHGIDLIVIGTHGRTGLNRFLIGSVAEKVVRHTRCPVLVIPSSRDR